MDFFCELFFARLSAEFSDDITGLTDVIDDLAAIRSKSPDLNEASLNEGHATVRITDVIQNIPFFELI